MELEGGSCGGVSLKDEGLSLQEVSSNRLSNPPITVTYVRLNIVVNNFRIVIDYTPLTMLIQNCSILFHPLWLYLFTIALMVCSVSCSKSVSIIRGGASRTSVSEWSVHPKMIPSSRHDSTICRVSSLLCSSMPSMA